MVIFIGFDPREERAYRVCVQSIEQHDHAATQIRRLSLHNLRDQGFYTRKHTRDEKGQLWDEISEAPMSTEFAISRFLVPYLMEYKGWALYCDCDFMFRADVNELFALADEQYAVMVVKHSPRYTELGALKMDNQMQTYYPRKLWSSLMLFNCGHQTNKRLDLDTVNHWPGRHLHAFRWLDDREIGSLPMEWNWIEMEPKAVHFTKGTPDMPGYGTAAYADEWWGYAGG